MTAPTLAVLLSPEQLAELADQIAARLSVPAAVPAPLKLAYTIPEAAQASGCSEWDIRQAITRGELHARQAGQRGRYVIPHAHLDAWLRCVPITLSAPPARGQRAKAR